MAKVWSRWAGATVNQVLLYWEAGHRHGDISGDEPDSDIVVNGVDVNADERIGGETFFYGSPAGEVYTATHRTDITSLGLIGAGTTTITVDGLDLDEVDDGAGVLVVYSEPDAAEATIDVRDGNDIAFVNFDPPLDATVPQTFTFESSTEERTASLAMIVSSIHDPVPGCDCRPNFMDITVGGETTRIPDPFPDTQGREFDSGSFDVVIPAGETEVTVEMVSDFLEGNPSLPASLVWLTAALTVPPPAQAPTTTTTTSTTSTTTTQPPAVSPTSAVVTIPETGPSGGPSGTAVVVGLGALAAGAVLIAGARARNNRTTGDRTA